MALPDAVEFVLNGEPRRARVAWPQMTLLDWLREQGYTGAKEGCAEGECGACAVAVLVSQPPVSADQPPCPAYRVLNSCLVFLPMAHGREIVTVEGLAAGGALTDVQRAMAAAGGSQCGYCTPGFVMSLFAEQYRPERTGPCDPLATAGNLCRCTGYRPIRDAALALGPPSGPHADRLRRPVAAPGDAVVDGYWRPATLRECLETLAADPAAKVVAGATDVGVESNVHGQRWDRLVDLDAIDELKTFEETPAAVRIGAALPLTDIGRLWTQAPLAVHEWLTLFASPPVRNRATLGGSLATASPIGDAAPLLAALDARLHVAAAAGTRTIDVDAFFTGYRRTALQPGELLTAIEIPRPLPPIVRFYKISKRRLDDISTVAAAMSVDVDGTRTVRRARFAFGGVAATPLRIRAAEDAVVGRAWDAQAVARVQDVLARTLRPMSDHRGSAEYRLAVSQALIEKFWWETRT